VHQHPKPTLTASPDPFLFKEGLALRSPLPSLEFSFLIFDYHTPFWFIGVEDLPHAISLPCFFWRELHKPPSLSALASLARPSLKKKKPLFLRAVSLHCPSHLWVAFTIFCFFYVLAWQQIIPFSSFFLPPSYTFLQNALISFFFFTFLTPASYLLSKHDWCAPGHEIRPALIDLQFPRRVPFLFSKLLRLLPLFGGQDSTFSLSQVFFL